MTPPSQSIRITTYPEDMSIETNRRDNMCREELIEQLRHALHLATSPSEDVVEFEIGDTEFCFEFEEK